MTRFVTSFTLACILTLDLNQDSTALASEIECTRKCSVTDEDLGCWKQSLDFFTMEVEKSLSNYAKLWMHVNRWHLRHPTYLEDDGMQQFAEASIDRVLESSKEKGEENPGLLTPSELNILLKLLLNQTRMHEMEYNDAEIVPPWVPCPISCDYYPKLWSILFYVILACFLLCVMVLLLYVCANSCKQDGYHPQKVDFVYT